MSVVSFDLVKLDSPAQYFITFLATSCSHNPSAEQEPNREVYLLAF